MIHQLNHLIRKKKEGFSKKAESPLFLRASSLEILLPETGFAYGLENREVCVMMFKIMLFRIMIFKTIRKENL